MKCPLILLETASSKIGRIVRCIPQFECDVFNSSKSLAKLIHGSVAWLQSKHLRNCYSHVLMAIGTGCWEKSLLPPDGNPGLT